MIEKPTYQTRVEMAVALSDTISDANRGVECLGLLPKLDCGAKYLAMCTACYKCRGVMLCGRIQTAFATGLKASQQMHSWQ